MYFIVGLLPPIPVEGFGYEDTFRFDESILEHVEPQKRADLSMEYLDNITVKIAVSIQGE